MSLSDDAKKLDGEAGYVRQIRALESKLAKAETAEKQTSARVKHLESLVEQQAERIDHLAKKKFKLPRAAAMLSGKASYCRVIIPDTHGCFIDEQAIAAVFRDLESISESVREVILLGDHLDCGGFLAQHHTLGYVAEAEYSFSDDVTATNVLLDRLQTALPHATFDYLEGNHERRIEKWCVTQALGHKQDAGFLASLFSTEAVLHLEHRGIRYFKQGKFYEGLRIPATIKRGRCYFTHGSRTCRNPAAAMLKDFGANVVFGHIHAMDSDSGRTVKDGEMGAWCPGCLCRLQPLWNNTQITRWSHGYGLQLVREDGDFLHINVPVINGRSYLMQLTEKM